MFKKLHYVIAHAIILATGLMVACGSERPQARTKGPAEPVAPKPIAKVGAEAREVAKKEGASFLAQIPFKKNSYDLSDTARGSLQTLITKSRAAGRVETIHLIVWADQEYPSRHLGQLNTTEIKLADRRAKAVFDYLRDHEVKANVEAYNMAERPNAIQSFLSTADARIKKSLESEGIATTAQDLSAPEYASKAVVLVLLAK